MIIRPVCSSKYVSIPNAVLNDERLSIDTRGMVAHILSKPTSWDIRPGPLAKALSRKGSAPLGRKRLNRMFREAMDAGYMARSSEQTHRDDGSWGPYAYVVGMPSDVEEAVAKSGVAFSPQRPEAHAPQGRAPNVPTNHKIQSQKSQIEKKPPLTPPAKTASPQACRDQYSEYGKHALASGCKFVWEGSKPYKAWIEHRGAEGLSLLPPTDMAIVEGKQRRGAWFPQLYPPGRRGGAATSNARRRGCCIRAPEFGSPPCAARTPPPCRQGQRQG
jgi:hypothetical protein